MYNDTEMLFLSTKLIKIAFRAPSLKYMCQSLNTEVRRKNGLIYSQTNQLFGPPIKTCLELPKCEKQYREYTVYVGYLSKHHQTVNNLNFPKVLSF